MRVEFIDNEGISRIRHGKTKNAKLIGRSNPKRD